MNSPNTQKDTPSPPALALHFRKFGENGPDLVVLHGLFGSGKNWRSFARSFENDFQVWTLDARNHGESPHAETMSYLEMAEDVICFLDKNELKTVILLGHSMGGKTAMQVALRLPNRISALIAVDIASVRYEKQQQQLGLIEVMQELHFTAEMSRAEIKKKLAEKIPEKRLLSFLMTNLTLENGRFRWRIGLGQISAGMQNLLKFTEIKSVFSGPTQFIGGENSDYIKTEYHSLIRKSFPLSRITMLKNCGHWLHVDSREHSKKMLTNFCSKMV